MSALAKKRAAATDAESEDQAATSLPRARADPAARAEKLNGADLVIRCQPLEARAVG